MSPLPTSIKCFVTAMIITLIGIVGIVVVGCMSTLHIHPPKKVEKSEKIDQLETVKSPVYNEVKYGKLTYLVDRDGLYHDETGRVWKPILVTTTAYTWRDDGDDISIGAGDGKTATMKDAINTYGIAADPRTLPYGTTLYVSGYGEFKVDDTGGAMRQAWINDNVIHIDLRIPETRFDGVKRSIKECRKIALNHGRQENRMVLVLVE